MVSNVILDMGNVLLTYNPKVPLDLFCDTPEEKEAIHRELFLGPEWVQGDLGNLTDSQKYESIKRRIPEPMHAALKRCVNEWEVCMEPVAGAREFCEEAKSRGKRLFVLSNADQNFYEYFPRFAPFDFFDGIVVSSDLHLIKPDRRIYRHLLDAYQLRPGECLFIDDRQENVEAARQEGMLAEVFTGNFDAIRARLYEERKGWD